MKITVKFLDSGMKGINVLSSSSQYICWVALGNCTDYFQEVGLIGINKEPIIKRGSELKVFRLFLNSIESLNNIVDYLYFDKFQKKFESFDSFKSELLSKYPILFKINEIANAYKHCIRGSDKKGKFQENKNKLQAKNVYFDHSILEKAFEFWIKYHQKDDNVDLFGDIV